MRRFVRHIIFFGIVLYGILLCGDAIVTYAFHQKKTRKYVVWNDMIHDRIDANLLIMGNSRAWCHYSPQIMDSILRINTYNIGINGSAFNRQYARYDISMHYISHRPKYIIQNVEFYTLEHVEGYEREQFMPYMIYPYYRRRVCEIEPFSPGELYIPMYRYYKNNFYEEFTKYDDIVYKGYLGHDFQWDGSKMRDMTVYNTKIDSTSLAMFIDYIEHVKAEGIGLLFVLSPIYAGVTDKIQDLEELHNVYFDLAKEYDLPILDYTQWRICQDTTYFYNATHLNRTGAELFSIQLAHDLDSLGLLECDTVAYTKFIR